MTGIVPQHVVLFRNMAVVARKEAANAFRRNSSFSQSRLCANILDSLLLSSWHVLLLLAEVHSFMI